MMRDEIKRLYTLHADFLYRIAIIELCYEADARDVVRDTFLEYASRAAQHEDKKFQKTELLKILIKKCKNNIRRSKIGGGLCVDRPEEFCCGNEELFDTLTKLPDRYKIPYVLYRFEGMKIKDIGRAIKVTNSSAVLKIISACEMLKSESPIWDDGEIKRLYLSIKAPENFLFDESTDFSAMPSEKKIQRAETRFVKVLVAVMLLLVIIYAATYFAGGGVSFRTNGKNIGLKPRETNTVVFEYEPYEIGAVSIGNESLNERGEGASFCIGVYTDAEIVFSSGRYALEYESGNIKEIISGDKISGKMTVYLIDDGSTDKFSVSVKTGDDTETVVITKADDHYILKEEK